MILPSRSRHVGQLDWDVCVVSPPLQVVPCAGVSPVNQIRSRVETVGREERDVIWQGPDDLIN